MADEVRLLLSWALFSRFLLLFLQVIFNGCIIDYDSSTFIELDTNSTWFDFFLHKMFGGFAKWDAVYFLKIAEQGYTYEQYMAFFPLHPWILRTSVTIVDPVFCLLVNVRKRSLLMTCGWVLNTIYFTAAVFSLYHLTIRLFGRNKIALITSFLFCFNPAGVFFSSFYSESLFSCLQFSALYFFELGSFSSELWSLLLFGLGCATRSNGILSCGFITHRIAKNFISKAGSTSLSIKSTFYQNLCLVVNTGLKLITFNGIILSPFVLYQLYGYKLYCFSFDLNVTHSAWCINQTLPFSYSYIQDRYWDVGLLRYFEQKQMPNFLLAAPMLLLCSCSVFSYCCNKRNHVTLKTLGLLQIQDVPERLKRSSWHLPERKYTEGDSEFYHGQEIFLYIAHLAFMTLFGFTSMHVQVITRFICSASPVIYWYSAHVIMRETTEQEVTWKSVVIVGYFLLYFLIGTILHCNFYPWT